MEIKKIIDLLPDHKSPKTRFQQQKKQGTVTVWHYGSKQSSIAKGTRVYLLLKALSTEF